MIDDGLGFQLVPWRPALEQHLGQEVRGIATPPASTGASAANADWASNLAAGGGLKQIELRILRRGWLLWR